jgi:hypothetical protein
MTFPGLHLYPSSTVFPSAVPIGLDGLGIDIGQLNVTTRDTAGVLWRTFSPLIGWDGSPASSVQLTKKPRGAGAWASPRNFAAKPFTFNGRIEAPSVDALQVAIDQLNAAATLTDTVVSVQRGSHARSVIAFRQGEVMVADLTDVVVDWSLQMVASDPRKFTTAVTGNTLLPYSTGGIGVPTVVPTVVASTGSDGTVSLVNPGNATGAVVVRIDGPANGPVITHLGSGLQLTFDSTLVIASDEFLVVDMEAQTALANGQANRNSTITSRGWSGFEPGPNLWRVDSAAYDPLTEFTITATPAWQ